MEIFRVASQSQETLREFYHQSSRHPKPAHVSELMLPLLDALDMADHSPVWAYTSFAALHLKETELDNEWLVTALVYREDWMERARFRITYALPDPWYSAITFTEDPAVAAKLVVDGLRRACRGKQRNVTFEW